MSQKLQMFSSASAANDRPIDRQIDSRTDSHRTTPVCKNFGQMPFVNKSINFSKFADTFKWQCHEVTRIPLKNGSEFECLNVRCQSDTTLYTPKTGGVRERGRENETRYLFLETTAMGWE